MQILFIYISLILSNDAAQISASVNQNKCDLHLQVKAAHMYLTVTPDLHQMRSCSSFGTVQQLTLNAF